MYSTMPDLNGPDGILLTFPVRSLPFGDDVVRFSDEHLQNFDAQLFVYTLILRIGPLALMPDSNRDHCLNEQPLKKRAVSQPLLSSMNFKFYEYIFEFNLRIIVDTTSFSL